MIQTTIYQVRTFFNKIDGDKRKKFVTDILYILIVVFNISVCHAQTITHHFPINFVIVDEHTFGNESVPMDKLCEVVQQLNGVFDEAGIEFSINQRYELFINQEGVSNGRLSISNLEPIHNYHISENGQIADSYINFYIFNGKIILRNKDLDGVAELPIDQCGYNSATQYRNTIWLNFDSFTDNKGLIEHEIGHFFNLLHTFEGHTSPSDGCQISQIPNSDCYDDGLFDTYGPISTIDEIISQTYLYKKYDFGYFGCRDYYLDVRDWKNNDLIWKNYMQYNHSATLNSFTGQQIEKMEQAKYLQERVRLSRCPTPLSPISQSSISVTPNSINFSYNIDVASCFISCSSNQSSLINSIKKSNSTLKLQITKEKDAVFNSVSGYKQSFNSSVNSTIIVDQNLTISNNSISFTWDSNTSSSIYEPPIPGETYKATLAEINSTNNGFSRFSEELFFSFTTQSPSQNSTNIYTTTVNDDDFTIKWRKGNGSKRLVTVTECGNIHNGPKNGVDYGSNNNFVSAPSIVSSKIVYEGTGNVVNIRGLSEATCYHVRIYEFNGTGSNTEYLLTDPGYLKITTDGNMKMDIIYGGHPIIRSEYVDFDWITSNGDLSSETWTFQNGTPSSSNTGNNIRWSVPGTYNVTLTGTNAETGESTTKTIEVDVVNPGDENPDLEFTNVSLSKNPVLLSDFFDVDYTIANTGYIEGRLTSIIYYLSDNTQIDASDYQWSLPQSTTTDPKIYNGIPHQGKRRLQIPWDETSGNKYLILKLFSTGSENTSNNIEFIPITIQEPVVEKFDFNTFTVGLLEGGYVYNICHSNDGLFVGQAITMVGGTTYTPTITKVDENGYIEWQKTHIDRLSFLDRLYFDPGNISLPDGGALYSYYILRNGNGYSGRILVRIDSDGNVVYEKDYTIDNYFNLRTDVLHEQNNSIVIGCKDISLSDAILMKTDLNTNVSWTKEFSSFNKVSKIAAADGNNFYVVFDNNQLVKFNASGSVLWAKEFEESISDIYYNGTHTFLVGSTTRFIATGQDYVTRITSSNGNLNWFKVINGYISTDCNIAKDPNSSNLILFSDYYITSINTNGVVLSANESGIGQLGVGNPDLHIFNNNIFGVTIGGALISNAIIKINKLIEGCFPINLNATSQTKTVSYVNSSINNPINRTTTFTNTNLLNVSNVQPFNYSRLCGQECAVTTKFNFNPKICEGDEVEISYAGKEGTIFEWKVNNVIVSNNQDLVYTFSNDGNYTVSLKASNLLGCEEIYQETISINPNPSISISDNFSDCDENNGTMTANITSGTSPYDILWSSGETTNTISQLSAGSYTVTATDSNGCLSEFSQTLNCFDLQVDNFSIPILMNIGSSSTISWRLTNNGTKAFTGNIYLQVNEHGTLFNDGSRTINAGASVNLSYNLTPTTVHEGSIVPIKILFKESGTNDYYPIDPGDEFNPLYSNICNGTSEICDGVDNDCDGNIDEDVGTTYFQDFDGDSFGNPNNPIVACTLPSGYVNNAADCNDNNPNIHPNQFDNCDNIDNNCNGLIDEGIVCGPDCYNLYSLDVPYSISPAGPNTIYSTRSFSNISDQISDLNIFLDINHTFVGDLKITLISPSGHSAILFNQVCNSNDNLRIHFDDESTNTALFCSELDLSFDLVPYEKLNRFYGINPNGTWTLKIEDLANGSGGILRNWKMNFCVSNNSDVCGALLLNEGQEHISTTSTATFDNINNRIISCEIGQSSAPNRFYKIQGNNKWLRINTCHPDTDYDTVLDLYEYNGSCNNPNSIICLDGNDDYSITPTPNVCGTKSRLTFFAESGKSYLLSIHGYGGQSGNYKVTIEDRCDTPFLNLKSATHSYHKYRAKIIESTAIIDAQQNTYVGENSILLKPDFEVIKGSIFHGYIYECPN